MIWIPVVLVGFPLVVLLLRPFYIHRGLKKDEWLAEWFGDDFVPGALPAGSRAIPIHASAASVWPWLTQIGQDRAGFYSYRWLENLFGANMPDVREPRSEWSVRKPGEQLVMAPLDRFGKIAAMDIEAVRTRQAIVAKNWEGTWAFLLVTSGKNDCRLVARGTWRPAKSFVARILHALVFDPIHYVMEWKMLRTIKHLAESESAGGDRR